MFLSRSERNTPPDLIKGEPEWEVEQILDERTRRSGKQYLIRWKGYSEAHDSWEPRENINAPLLMAAFEKRRDTQDKESAQEQENTQKEAQRRSERTIRSRTIYSDKDIVCNQAPDHLTPHDQDLVPYPPSLSSNSRAAYYEDAAAMHGQTH